MSENLQQRAQKKVDALEAEIVEIRVTAEESKKLRADLLSKTTIIRKHVEIVKHRNMKARSRREDHFSCGETFQFRHLSSFVRV